MTETLTCDFCGKSAPSEGLTGWYQLEQTNWELAGWVAGRTPRWPKHFCSLNCLLAGIVRLKGDS